MKSNYFVAFDSQQLKKLQYHIPQEFKLQSPDSFLLTIYLIINTIDTGVNFHLKTTEDVL